MREHFLSSGVNGQGKRRRLREHHFLSRSQFSVLFCKRAESLLVCRKPFLHGPPVLSAYLPSALSSCPFPLSLLAKDLMAGEEDELMGEEIEARARRQKRPARKTRPPFL